MTTATGILENIKWNPQGLVPAITQDSSSGEILMLAWMNSEALQCTIDEGRAVYWSRSRQQLWHKGEDSGHVQILKELRLDCDRDTILMQVEQQGGIACHTGRRHCFMYKFDDGTWQLCEPVLKNPDDIYGESS